MNAPTPTPGQEPKPAPELAAYEAEHAEWPHWAEGESYAFKAGMRVRTAPCPVPPHHGDHFQVRAPGWTCGLALAATLVNAGVIPPPDGTPEQSAPELAAAMAEPRELRKVITEVLGMFKAVSGGWGARTSSSRLRKIAERAGVHWDSLAVPAPDSDDAAELAAATAVLAKVRAACERPAEVVGHTSGSRVVNGDYLARHLLDIIKRAGLPS